MHLDLHGKVVIITGATSGIGLASAHEIAAEGATVLAVVRREPASGVLPASADFVAADVTDLESAARLVAQVRERYGPIDGLVKQVSARTSSRLAQPAPLYSMRREASPNSSRHVSVPTRTPRSTGSSARSVACPPTRSAAPRTSPA